MFSFSPHNFRTYLLAALLTTTYPHISRAADDPIPFVLQFEKEFGPDGPWHGVPALVGTNRQQVYLYPAVQAFGSILFTTKVCDNWRGPGECPAKAGGLYDPAGSTTDQVGISWQANDIAADILSTLLLDKNVLKAVGSGEHVGVDMRLGGSSVNSNTIGNSSFIKMNLANTTLPGGKMYPLTLGFLSLGAPDNAQVFTRENEPPTVLPIPLNYLSVQHDIPSTSWSMHIGAAKLGQSGSMVWGGFDKSRVVGPVATYDTNGDTLNFQRFQLNDIWISVGAGTNPLGYKSGNKTGLLVTNETTTGDAKNIDVVMHSEVPYMYLPKATCDAIAKELPVSFNEEYGLYIWNTNSELFKNLRQSPAYLGFGFDYNTADGVEIKVPFSLLMLDLTAPITAEKENLTYFPCRPHEPVLKEGVYILGRAFLQAAFIGQSWKSGKYWLAQAPGPSHGTTSTVTINNDTVTLDVNPSKDAWTNSWRSQWKINDTVIPGGVEPTLLDNSSSGNKNGTSTSGLSTGAKAGIGAGAAAAVLGVGLLAFWLYMRHDKKLNRQKSNFMTDMPNPSAPPTSYNPPSSYAPTSYAGSYHPGYQPVQGHNQYFNETDGAPLELDATTVHKPPST